MVDISVAIVAYKNYEDIIEAIKSLEKYTSNCITKTLYIIDNSGQEDDCKNDRDEMIHIIEEFSDILYIDTGENLGYGKGNNYVLSSLNSRYHAIVNPDIVFIEDAFSKILNYMDTNHVKMCIPKVVDEKGNLQMVYRREVTVFDMFIRFFLKSLFKKRVAYHTLQDKDYSKPFHVPFGQGSFLVIDTALFKKLNGFDDRYFMYLEDADLCKRVNQTSQLMYYPDATVVHKWEQGSHKNLKLFKAHLDSMKKYFDKWGVKWF